MIGLAIGPAIGSPIALPLAASAAVGEALLLFRPIGHSLARLEHGPGGALLVNHGEDVGSTRLIFWRAILFFIRLILTN